MTKTHEFERDSELRYLTDIYTQIQKTRIALGNRLYAIQSGRDEGNAPLIERLHQQHEEMEKAIFRRMRDACKGHPAWPWLSQVRGVGPTLTTKVLGLIGNIETFTTISKLWRYAGYATVPHCPGCKVLVYDEEATLEGTCPTCGSDLDRRAERRQRGEKLHYNPRLKVTLHLVAEQFLKQNSPYRRIYDEAKAYYQRNRDWTPGHVHMAARRRMIKVFLCHLWLKWREAEGLPTRVPYAHEYLGHTTYYAPEEFTDRRAASL